ncbi:hypothetical protein MLD38_007689 [Melastoma candidum]|uniref:Uncharacterized protein n=1 Tax=Melastoma candidum TaxID=119954 RepID=A0ACB9RR29_9MYRT|nr:hypothetical protein MLD38_007689 [Melastoma candidum]
MAKNDDVPAAYMLLSSDGPGTQLTSCLLGDGNYATWSRAMLTALRAKNKVGFINGDIKKPETTNPLFDKWDQCNSMIVAWIFNHLERDVQRTVACAGDAKDLWDLLRIRFSQSNITEIHHIKTKICLLRQSGTTVREYFSEMTKLWDELEMLQQPPSCTCGAAADLATRWEHEKLHQFLIGLDPEYSAIRSTILDSDPLLTISQAYSKVSHVESQRRATQEIGSGGERLGFVATTDRTPDNARTRTREQCDYCGRPGHHRGNCYRLHGFPAPVPPSQSRQEHHGRFSSGSRSNLQGGEGEQTLQGPGQQRRTQPDSPHHSGSAYSQRRKQSRGSSQQRSNSGSNSTSTHSAHAAQVGELADRLAHLTPSQVDRFLGMIHSTDHDLERLSGPFLGEDDRTG